MSRDLFLNGLNGETPVKVLDGELLKHKIYWSFNIVSVSDEMDVWEGCAFDQRSHCLSDIFFYVSEENFDGENVLHELLKSPIICGLPYLVNPGKSFVTKVASDCKYLSRDGRYLLCMSSDDARCNAEDFLRLKIHDRLSMTFINGSHRGFILTDPFRSLVRFAGFDEEIDADRPVDLSKFLDEFLGYFDLMDLTAWDEIENRSPRIESKLRFIRNGLREADLLTEPIYALQEQCERLLSEYYDENQKEQ